MVMTKRMLSLSLLMVGGLVAENMIEAKAKSDAASSSKCCCKGKRGKVGATGATGATGTSVTGATGATGATGTAVTNANYLSAYADTTQDGSLGGAFTPITFNNVELENGWAASGTSFTNAQSGIYEVTYTVNVAATILTAVGGVGVQATLDGAPVLGSQSGEPQLLSALAGLLTINAAQVTRSFLVSYTAGQLLQIQFACTTVLGLPLLTCSITPGAALGLPVIPGTDPVSASISIVRIA